MLGASQGNDLVAKGDGVGKGGEQGSGSLGGEEGGEHAVIVAMNDNGVAGGGEEEDLGRQVTVVEQQRAEVKVKQ